MTFDAPPKEETEEDEQTTKIPPSQKTGGEVRASSVWSDYDPTASVKKERERKRERERERNEREKEKRAIWQYSNLPY